MKLSYKSGVLFLASALCLSFYLASCGDSSPAAEATDAPAAIGEEPETTAAPETDEYGRVIYPDPITDDLDFGGYEIKMLSRDNVRWYIDFGVEELNGDIVNDAVYNRNLAVENELNVKFSRILVDCGDMTATKAVLDNFYAGESAYDIAGLYQLYGGSASLTGAFVNLYDVPYLNFSNPWWNRSFTDELTYDGQLYYSVGDMNLSVTSTLMGVFFNQGGFESYYGDIGQLYDVVRQGGWTKDKFKEYITGTYSDLNGNGKKDIKDYFGFILDEADIGPWLPAFDIRLITKDESGVPQLSYFNEKSVAAHEWMYDFFLDHPDVFFAAKNSGYMKVFKEDRALFAIIKLDDAATTLRDMESSFGMVPMPKYDEAQKEYYNAAHDNSNLTGITAGTQNPDAVGAALELMSYYSYRTITPAYFEVALKAKYLRDNDSAEMFEIIRDGAIVDFGQIYSLEIGGGSYSFDTTYHLLSRNQIRNKNRDITSRYMKNEELYQRQLDSILEHYKELGAAH